MNVSAPGKLFLAGEYGVLAGGPAVTLAVDRRVRTVPATLARMDPLASECLAGAYVYLSAHGRMGPATLPALDLSAHRAQGQKLGLGSSAASAAVWVAASFAAAGLDVEPNRDAVFEVAWRAHTSAGGGSGADVAAAVYGGTVAVTPAAPSGTHGALAPPEVEALDLDPGWMPVVVAGGRAVSSREVLARLEASPARDALLSRARAAGERLVEAMRGAPDEAAMGAVTAAAEAMVAVADALDLGADGGRTVLERCQAIAARYGGAAKPSGAAAGELCLVFLPRLDPKARAELKAALRGSGLRILDVKMDSMGVETRGGSTP